MRIESTRVDTPRGRVALRDTGGDGPPILLVHGSGSSSAVFDRQMQSAALAPSRLIAVDLPGHGHSDDLEDVSGYGIVELAETVSAILGVLRLADVTILGWSLGGHVALQLAATDQRVCGLMLCGTPPVSRGPLGTLRAFQAHWDLFLASKRVFSERDVTRFAELCFGRGVEPHLVDDIRRADGRLRMHYSRTVMRGDGIDQRRFVETSGIPVAIVNGAADPFLRLTYFDQIDFANLWRGRCHVVPASGHDVFRHAAELVDPLLAAFAADAAEEARQARFGHRTATNV